MKRSPSHWLTASGAEVLDFVTSGSRGWARYYSETGVPFIRIGNLDHGTIAIDLSTVQHVVPPRGAEADRTRIRPGDILVSITAELGMIGVVPDALGEAFINQHIALARPCQDIDPRFLAWYLASEVDGKRQLQEMRRGATKAGLGLDDIRGVALPLAPRNEQKRIADKLAAVLARVDNCRERLDRVPDILKRFRQAVLAAAVSGRLTADWRAAQPDPTASQADPEDGVAEPAAPDYVAAVDPDSAALHPGNGPGGSTASWRSTTFGAVCKEITVGHVGKMADEYCEGGIPFLRSLNVRPFRFDSRNLMFISPAFHRSLRKSALGPGDVVVVRTGAPGQCCVIPRDLIEANCSDLVIVRPGPQLLPDFATVVINSDAAQAFVKAEQVGVAQNHFNVGSMKRAPILLPTLAEQEEVVVRVETLFAYANRLEARYAAARAQVERLTPALLAKAFRGELVPQDPDDEPASVLLERIRAARAAGPAKPKRGRAATTSAAGRQAAIPDQGGQAQLAGIARPGAGRTERGEDDEPNSTYLRSAIR